MIFGNARFHEKLFERAHELERISRCKEILNRNHKSIPIRHGFDKHHGPLRIHKNGLVFFCKEPRFFALQGHLGKSMQQVLLSAGGCTTIFNSIAQSLLECFLVVFQNVAIDKEFFVRLDYTGLDTVQIDFRIDA